MRAKVCSTAFRRNKPMPNAKSCLANERPKAGDGLFRLKAGLHTRLFFCLFSAILFLGTTVTAAEPRVISLRELPLLFADDSGIAASAGVIRTVHPARQRNAPVMEPETAWEGSRVYIYGSV